MGTLWRPDEHSVGKSLLKRFASITGPKGALGTAVARPGAVSPNGISAGGLAWISEELRSGDVVEAHEAMRTAPLEAGAAHPPKECGMAPGAATTDDAPGPAGGANESPAAIPRFSSPGIPDSMWSGPVLPDLVCPQALARLRERWNGHESFRKTSKAPASSGHSDRSDARRLRSPAHWKVPPGPESRARLPHR